MQRSVKLPIPVEYHQKYFPIDANDDDWMPDVGLWGWTVVGHDSHHHTEPAELSAIKQYDMGCFYLWGAKKRRWEKMRCFLRAYERIKDAEANTPKPFIYRVSENGRLSEVPLA